MTNVTDRWRTRDAATVADRVADAPPATPRRGRRGVHRRPRSGLLRRVTSFLVVLLAIAFFFGPAVAGLLGVRAGEVENRRLRGLPSLADGFALFDGLTGWASDHLPLRDQAIRANTELSQRVFGELPDYRRPGGAADATVDTPFGPAGAPAHDSGVSVPVVVPGRDGWLFLGADFANACAPQVPTGQMADRLARLARIVTSSGRRFVATVAPDKSTIEQNLLADDFPGKECSAAARKAVWPTLGAADIPGYVDVYSTLRQLRGADPIYRQTDTHWGQRGQVAYARLVADALDPSLWPTTDIEPAGVRDTPGDLASLLGIRHTDADPGYTIYRPGVTRVGDPTSLTRIENTTTGAPLYTPDTLLIGDSFTDAALGFFLPLFANLTVVRNNAPADELIAAIVSSDTVIYEAVERSFAFGYDSPLLDPDALDRLEAALASNPAPAR